MCADYERAIVDAGGVDLQLLGVGSDGHVAFNEPGSSLSSRTRIKTLTARTRADNERFFEPPDEVPHHVLTQGLGTILEARHLVLIARGPGKAPAVHQLSRGRCPRPAPRRCCSCTRTPPSCWTTTRPSQLQLADYYRETYAGKPEWQGVLVPAAAEHRVLPDGDTVR